MHSFLFGKKPNQGSFCFRFIFIFILLIVQSFTIIKAQKINLKLQNAPFSDAISRIKQQSKWRFLYDVSLIKEAKPVSLILSTDNIYQIMDSLIKGQNLIYNIISGTITITSKKKDVNTSNLQQQPVLITGLVIDSVGIPLAGATVTAINSNSKSTITDSKGKFSIMVLPNTQIEITYVGYESNIVMINKSQTLKIILNQSHTSLNDVVIIGYGSVQKKDLTGSVSSANVQDMQKAPVSSFTEALAGRIAGVQVSSNDGQPGSNSNIIIRGTNSITQDNSPLYVIDGFPIENPNANSIDPADIESIDVLKDASATAIYGARGSNGVIIITTKRGRNGMPPVISYNGYLGYNQTIKKPALLDPYEFVKLMDEVYPANTDSTYLKNNTLDDYKNVKGINWEDEVMHTAPFWNSDLAVRGGSSTSNYSISLNAFNQSGAVINSGFKRYQGRIVMDQKIGTKVKVGGNVNYATSEATGLTVGSYGGNDRANSFLASVWGYRPLAGAYSDSLDAENNELINSGVDPDISLYYYNPLSTAKNTVNNRYADVFTANVYFQYNIMNNLILKVTGGYTKETDKNNVFYNSHTSQGDVNTGKSTGPYGSVTYANKTNFVNENTLDYQRRFNKHNLDILGGFTVSGYDYSTFGATGSNVPNESLGVSGLDEGTPSAITSSISNNRLMSFLSRVNYNYNSKYYLTASIRADGSSKFAPQNHWSYFPSGAIAWQIAKESFMKNISFINNAKLRVTYGSTGNNRVSDFPYLSTITLPLSAAYPFGGDYTSGALLSSLGNKNLKWETTKQADAGLDIEFFNSRISFTTDYYNKKTSNLLLNATLPGSSGYANVYENIGKVQNSGWEFTLNTINIQSKNFSWNSSFNISFNRNKVLELESGQESLLSGVSWSKNGYGSAPAYIAKVGQPIALFYGYVFDGLYQYSDFNAESNGTYVLKDNIPNNGSTRSTIQPGYIKYKDLNGDGVVDSKDQTIIGNPNPIHTGGFSNNFIYKNFDLSVFFQWSYGNQIMNANRYVMEGELGTQKNQFASYANRWTPENTNTDIPAILGNGPYVYSSRVVEDGSYLRLKTVQIGYTLPANFLKKLKIKTFHVYASAQNLFTWTSYYSGLDPEVSSYNSALTPGFDYSAYPRARTITFGLNASF
ncbi:MAG: TonB-dependent receptor [Arachidicoccus sp.]|nr:TonB-dependent receptor [Arachidicoccus sp.]